MHLSSEAELQYSSPESKLLGCTVYSTVPVRQMLRSASRAYDAVAEAAMLELEVATTTRWLDNGDEWSS